MQVSFASFLTVRKGTLSARILPISLESVPEAAQAALVRVKAAYGGRVPNIHATIAQSPSALEAFIAWGQALAHGSLTPREVELINLHTSQLNGCAYCVSAHSGLGRKAGLSSEEVEAARAGRIGSPREDAILSLARRIIRTGGHGSGAELTVAREAGLTDGAIIEVLAHVAVRSFTNAVAIMSRTDIDVPRAPHLPEP
jgi:uncharacterized peroxidase-related enzyme